jgi:hypothetical protein
MSLPALLLNGYLPPGVHEATLVQEGFDREFAALSPPQRYVFEHEQARLRFEADIFWATEAVGAGVLASWLSVYQLSRDMEQRGIVEVILDD